MKYYIMEHRGGLDESLKTRKEISEDKFYELLPLYEFYCYDDRINCNRYILKDMEYKYNNYTIWLLKEIKTNNKFHNIFKEVL